MGFITLANRIVRLFISLANKALREKGIKFYFASEYDCSGNLNLILIETTSIIHHEEILKLIKEETEH
jgi:hypothetical protein